MIKTTNSNVQSRKNVNIDILTEMELDNIDIYRSSILSGFLHLTADNVLFYSQKSSLLPISQLPRETTTNCVLKNDPARYKLLNKYFKVPEIELEVKKDV